MEKGAEDGATRLWSDSTSVLKYIKNETSRFRVFVANSVRNT